MKLLLVLAVCLSVGAAKKKWKPPRDYEIRHDRPVWQPSWWNQGMSYASPYWADRWNSYALNPYHFWYQPYPSLPWNQGYWYEPWNQWNQYHPTRQYHDWSSNDYQFHGSRPFEPFNAREWQYRPSFYRQPTGEDYYGKQHDASYPSHDWNHRHWNLNKPSHPVNAYHPYPIRPHQSVKPNHFVPAKSFHPDQKSSIYPNWSFNGHYSKPSKSNHSAPVKSVHPTWSVKPYHSESSGSYHSAPTKSELPNYWFKKPYHSESSETYHSVPTESYRPKWFVKPYHSESREPSYPGPIKSEHSYWPGKPYNRITPKPFYPYPVPVKPDRPSWQSHHFSPSESHHSASSLDWSIKDPFHSGVSESFYPDHKTSIRPYRLIKPYQTPHTEWYHSHPSRWLNSESVNSNPHWRHSYQIVPDKHLNSWHTRKNYPSSRHSEKNVRPFIPNHDVKSNWHSDKGFNPYLTHYHSSVGPSTTPKPIDTVQIHSKRYPYPTFTSNTYHSSHKTYPTKAKHFSIKKHVPLKKNPFDINPLLFLNKLFNISFNKPSKSHSSSIPLDFVVIKKISSPSKSKSPVYKHPIHIQPDVSPIEVSPVLIKESTTIKPNAVKAPAVIKPEDLQERPESEKENWNETSSSHTWLPGSDSQKLDEHSTKGVTPEVV